MTLWPSLLLVFATALLVGIPLRAAGFDPNPLWIARASAPAFATVIGGALLLRLTIHRFRTGAWPRLPTRQCLTESAFLLGAIVTLMALVGTYCWGKLLIPYFRPDVIYDEQLIAIDRFIHFGLDPRVTLRTALQSAPWLDTIVDVTYSQYPAVMLGIAGWFLTAPDRGDRHRFLRGFVLLWLSGLALYWLVPSLGPAFVFTDLGAVLSDRYPLAFDTERLLRENYMNLESILSGRVDLPLRIEYGIAAFPSLHVAIPVHGWLFASERRHPLRIPLLIISFIFMLGALLTGWHYMVDVWAGIALAALCWAVFRRPRQRLAQAPA